MRRAFPVALMLIALAAPAAADEHEDSLPSPDALDPAARKDLADRLFQQAHAALEADDWVAACAKFRASMRYDISVSTQLNIARCHEREGKLVEAWGDYNRARLLNRDTPDAERREALGQYVEEAAAKLEARLPRLRVVVPQPPPDLVISSDGRVLGQLAAGEPVPLDPGSHVIEVRAPGYRSERREIEMVEGKTAELVVTLEAGEDGDAEPAVPAPEPPIAPPPPSPRPASEGGAPAWAWAGGAIGLAAAGVAIGLGVDSAAARSELADNCEVQGESFVCSTARYTQRDVDGLVSRANLHLGLAVGFGAVSAAALTAAVVGLVRGEQATDKPSDAYALPFITPQAAGVVAGYRY
jgi:hypothetical protein